MKAARQFPDLAASVIALAAFLAVGEPIAADALIERGSYLVNAVMACDSCHTPRGPKGALLMDKRFSGGSQTWDEPTFVVKGANITPDLDTGISTWSEHDLKHALIDGVRPAHARLGGIPLVPQMPFNFYKILLPHDLEAVVAYVRSVAPVHNEVQPPIYKATTEIKLVPVAISRRCPARSTASASVAKRCARFGEKYRDSDAYVRPLPGTHGRFAGTRYAEASWQSSLPGRENRLRPYPHRPTR
jgi:mono/diheme cytochrome c family protein